MNILLFAYHFPPLDDAGARRPVAMKKYLARLGHRVTVVTHSYVGNTFDPSNGEIRILDLHRSGSKKLSWFCLRVQERIARLGGKHLSPHRFWSAGVMNHLGKILSETKPDIVMATYPPAETLELGLEASKTIGVPFVADFRDGLIFEPIDPRALSDSLNRVRLERFEREIAAQAGAIVTVSEPISSYFSGTLGAKTVMTIPNGYDPEEIPSSLAPIVQLNRSKFNIVHTGRFSMSDKGCDIRPFLSAAENVFPTLDSKTKRPCILLIGELSAEERHLTSPLMQKGFLEIHAPVPHEEALRIQREADLLLLITSTSRSSVATTKVFEYLKAGRPIVALTQETYAEQIIRDTGTGWVVSPEDREEIQKTLSKIINDPSQLSSLRPDSARIASFSRPHQIAVLSNLLESLARSSAK